jgi:hypothetical protein
MKIEQLRELTANLRDLEVNVVKIETICIKLPYSGYNELQEDMNGMVWMSSVPFNSESPGYSIGISMGGVSFLITSE